MSFASLEHQTQINRLVQQLRRNGEAACALDVAYPLEHEFAALGLENFYPALLHRFCLAETAVHHNFSLLYISKEVDTVGQGWRG